MKSAFKLKVRHMTLTAWILVWAFSANAAPPTSGAYIDDLTRSHVSDATSEALFLPNTVLCYMNGSGGTLDAVVNTGNYIALVDKNKCERGDSSSNSVSGSSGADSAPNFLVAVVNSTRSSNSAPLNGKIWFRETSLANSGSTGTIYANLSASQSVSASSPYGKFHTDFCGLLDNTSNCPVNAPFLGYADGDGASISASQTGTSSRNHMDISIKLTGTVDAGAGRVKFAEVAANNGGIGQSGDWVFAYNSTHFRRAENGGNNNQCFDRSWDNADKSAWSYGVYDSSGARLNRTSGFPIKTQSGENGYIGYWGMWLPNGVSVNDGDTVTRFSYSNNQANAGSYTVVKKEGRLKKLELHNITLRDVINVPFYLWVSTTFADSLNISRPGNSQLEVKWNGANFVITGVLSGGSVTPVSGSPTIPAALYASDGQWGWNLYGYSQSIGGSITIALRNASGTYLGANDSTVVSYRTEAVMVPGDSAWPANLICISDCPAGSISNETALNNASHNPYKAGTQFSWQPILLGSAVNYTSSNGILMDGANAVAWTGSAPTNPLNAVYANGYQSGRLLNATDANQIKCNSDGSTNPSGLYYCANKLNSVNTAYVWETGASSWNKYAGLSSGGTTVAFDPPMALTYTVPNNSTPYANTSLVLQYNGFGELQGIPGMCVNPQDNSTVPCAQNTRWVPALTIPTGGTVTDGSNTYYVKPLQQELRLKAVSSGMCSALNLPTIADRDMPTIAGWTDPTTIGTMPSLASNTAPKVIDGVLQ